MNPKFNRGEYWLLESAVTFRNCIHGLDSDEIDLDMNKPGHGMSRGLLIQTLVGLFQTGLIYACGPQSTSDEDRLTARQIDVAVNERDPDRQWWYGLTAEGGRQWEAFAAPRWEEHIDVEETGDGGVETGEYGSMNLDRLRRYIDGLHYLGVNIIPDTLKWDIVEPWEATYWKTLPRAHRARFHFIDDVDGIIMWDEIPTSFLDLNKNRFYWWK